MDSTHHGPTIVVGTDTQALCVRCVITVCVCVYVMCARLSELETRNFGCDMKNSGGQ